MLFFKQRQQRHERDVDDPARASLVSFRSMIIMITLRAAPLIRRAVPQITSAPNFISAPTGPLWSRAGCAPYSSITDTIFSSARPLRFDPIDRARARWTFPLSFLHAHGASILTRSFFLPPPPPPFFFFFLEIDNFRMNVKVGRALVLRVTFARQVSSNLPPTSILNEDSL